MKKIPYKPVVDPEAVVNKLPHGSGIDSMWGWNTFKNGNVTFYNSYHVMNEVGFYDGWEDFSVRVFKIKRTIINVLRGPCEGDVQVVFVEGDLDWQVRMSGTFRNEGSRYGVREDLEQIIEIAMSELKIGMIGRDHMSVREARKKYPNAEWRGV